MTKPAKRLQTNEVTRAQCGECAHAEPHPERDGKLLCAYQSQRITVDPKTYCMVTVLGFERKSGAGSGGV